MKADVQHVQTHLASPAGDGEMNRSGTNKNKKADHGARHGARSKRTGDFKRDHHFDRNKTREDSEEEEERSGKERGSRGGRDSDEEGLSESERGSNRKESWNQAVNTVGPVGMVRVAEGEALASPRITRHRHPKPGPTRRRVVR